jgi:serine/threonine-protein kinase
MAKQRRTVIAKRYELIQIAGTGGMAAVWRGVMRDHGQERPVAVKRMLVDIARDPTVVALFVEEARVGLQLVHPNIVRVLDFGTDETGAYYLAMEWVEGLDLFDYMRSFHAAGVHVPWQAVASIGYQALRGLEAAHDNVDAKGHRRPVIHRDLSPSNILVGVDGVAKVADFGLARATDRATMTFPNMIKGKVSYTAPELMRGHKANERSDIYCLGVTLWECLAARKLFPGANNIEVLRAIQTADIPSLTKYRPDTPAELASAVQRAVQRSPELRWKTALEMAGAFGDVLRAIVPPVDARRLGASVLQARDRLAAIEGQIPVTIEDSREGSIEVSVNLGVDFQSSPASVRSFRAELSEPFMDTDLTPRTKGPTVLGEPNKPRR